jgi:hypothetical protein
MFAYRRLVAWSLSQSFNDMRSRARTDLTFHDFVQTPGEHRGQLVELSINARLIRKCPEPPKFAVPLYEVWGPSPNSGAWLYSAVVVNLPEGIPVGERVDVRIKLVGYFLKLQSYYPAIAKPNSPPLVAPLFIGRMVWVQPKAPEVQKEEWWYLWGVVGGFAAVALVVAFWAFFGPRGRRVVPPSAIPRSKVADATVDVWLDQTAEASEQPPSDSPRGEDLPQDRAPPA